MLQADVAAWLKRRDLGPRMPGWCAMVETDIAEKLRARCMIARATQPVDAAFITLPVDFCSIDAIRWADSGNNLALEDGYSGPADAYSSGGQTCAYRLVGDCIEFLPPPAVPDPPDPAWTPRAINMSWYQKPAPLVQPQDTNPVLERLYSIYLFGMCLYGAMYELDTERAGQMQTAYEGAIMTANLWKQASDYSGAPLRAVVKGGF